MMIGRARRLMGTVRNCRGLCSSAPRVSVTRSDDGIVQVALCRPEKLNALDIDMFRAIRDAARDIISECANTAIVTCVCRECWFDSQQ